MSFKRVIPVICVAALAMILAACGEKKVAPQAVAAATIKGARITFPADSPQVSALGVTTVVALESIPVEIPGRLVWDENRTVRIYSPFGGRVTRIAAQPGDMVKAGQVLALLASPEFGQAQADAGKAQADYSLAEKSLARVRQLHEHGVAPRKDLSQAEADYARARSELTRAHARVGLYGGNTGVDQALAVKSPIAGTVVERNINPGQELRSDQGTAPALFVVTDPGRLWVQVDAHVNDLPMLRKGMSFRLKVAGEMDAATEARLEVIADFIDPQTRVIRARGAVANADRRLKAEMLVTAVFDPVGRVGVGVPARAVVFADGGNHAFVETAKGVFERMRVTTGAERGGLMTVTSGLTVGQKVVSEGALLLQQLFRGAGSKSEAE